MPGNGIEVRVVTDAETLLPYRVHRSRRLSLVIKEVAGDRRQDEIDMVYAYPAASSGACGTGQ